MTLAIACDYCDPWSMVSSPGVSAESTALIDQDRAARDRELARAEETKVLRQHRVIPQLMALHRRAAEDNWDGEGAPALTLDAITDASSIIGQIPEQYPMPELHAEQTGEVGLEWFVDSYRILLLSLPGDGYVYYNALFGFKNSDYGCKPIAGRLHQKILSLLDEVYR